jgi:hypothetical protein
MHGTEGPIAVDPLVGQVLAGRFRVVKLIDRGGMGKVYKAIQEPLGRVVALKTLDLVDQHGEFRQRFFLEASLCSKLSHPNTIRVFDYGATDDGVYFIAMEYLEGRTLRTAIREKALGPRRAVHIFRQICGAITEAHQKGIIHRDLKPANIFLTDHGDDRNFVKVLDFGLVKDLEVDAGLSQADKVLGSPLYMSPEQIEAKELDKRTDQYSVGIMLYVALTGKVPYKTGNTVSLMMQQVNKIPPAFADIAPELEIPTSLEWLVRQCIAKQPEGRFASMAELGRGLKLVGKEIAGELGPIDFGRSDAGRLILPDGLIDEEVTWGAESPVRLERAGPMAEEVSGGTLRQSAIRTTAPMAALGAGVMLLGAVAVGALVTLLIGTLMYFEPWGPELTPPTTPKEAAEVPVPAPKGGQNAPIEVQIASEPTGADVSRDGSLIGTTPMGFRLPDGEAWQLEIALAGHEPRIVAVDGSTTSVTVRLSKRATARPTTRPSQPVTPKPAPKARLEEVRDPWAE